jgi:hypothetical protein
MGVAGLGFGDGVVEAFLKQHRTETETETGTEPEPEEARGMRNVQLASAAQCKSKRSQ